MAKSHSLNYSAETLDCLLGFLARRPQAVEWTGGSEETRLFGTSAGQPAGRLHHRLDPPTLLQVELSLFVVVLSANTSRALKGGGSPFREPAGGRQSLPPSLPPSELKYMVK